MNLDELRSQIIERLGMTPRELDETFKVYVKDGKTVVLRWRWLERSTFIAFARWLEEVGGKRFGTQAEIPLTETRQGSVVESAEQPKQETVNIDAMFTDSTPETPSFGWFRIVPVESIGLMPFQSRLKPTAMVNFKGIDYELANILVSFWKLIWEREAPCH